MWNEADFQTKLDENPQDHTTRLIFADWLDDRDDPRAAGYRALAKNDVKYGDDNKNGIKRDFVWMQNECPGVQYYSNLSSLPDDWYSLLTDYTQKYSNGDSVPETAGSYGLWKDYGSRKLGEDAAALAFTKLPLERQMELLQGVPDAVK